MTKSNDLFLLLLNLSQIRNPKRVLEMFVQSLGELFAPYSFVHKEQKPGNEAVSFSVTTRNAGYGFIIAEAKEPVSEEDQVFLHNATQMLAIILERLYFEENLEKEKVAVKKVADQRLTALEATTDKYRKYVDNAPLGVFIVNKDRQFLEVNNEGCTITGYTAEELENRKIDDLVDEESLDDVKKHFTNVIKKGRASTEGAFRTKAGEKRWWNVVSTGLSENLIIGFAIDITDRKRAEDALERKIVALTQPLDSLKEILFEDLFDMPQIQRLQDEFAIATGVASIITKPDGTPITVPSNFSRLCRDIIRKAESGRKNCEKVNAMLVQPNSKGPTIKRCPHGGLLHAGAAISVGGRHIANWIIGQIRTENIIEEKICACAREIGATEQEAIKAFNEIPIMPKEHFYKVGQVLFTLANQLSNGAYQNIQQARFITLRKEAEAERDKMQTQLMQAQKLESVGRLAGGIAHDFNNMLGVILGHCEMALDRPQISQALINDITEINKAARRSADLTRQLLAFARKQTVVPKVLNLNEVLKNTINMLRRLIGEGILLTWKPCMELWSIKIDPGQLDQVLVNLCVNAKDAISGIGKINIVLSNSPFEQGYCAEYSEFTPGDYVLLSIIDNGCGMDRDTLAHIFEPFFTTKKVGEGTGLGLATVYGVVKQNKGLIDVVSEPGKGSTFKIYFPRYSFDDCAEVNTTVRVAEAGNETILLVEDEPMILDMTTIMLEKLGYTVIPAQTPVEALLLANKHSGKIHLLITDVVMPEMNGRDLAKSILSVYPDIARIFMSGYTADVIAHHGVLEKGVNFIQKPFTTKILAAKVREALDDTL